MNMERETIKRLEADIAVIKEAIRTNNGFVSRIIAAPVLGRFFLALGVVCIVLPLGWQVVLARYTWWGVVQELSRHPILNHQFLVVGLTVFLSIVAGISGNAYLVPAVFVAATVLVPGVSPQIMTAIGYGGGFCYMAYIAPEVDDNTRT